nr:hypothetical protein [Micromonospora sp. DSM 115978]
MTPPEPARPPRRLAPAIGLLVLAPWVGEYLLGNVPAGEILALPFLVPLYGGGALLIREVTRRAGRGWPTILLLGVAYGLIEAGLVDQSLFNPSFEGHEFQRVTPVPAIGISGYHTLSFLVGHAVWSIGVPIAIVELLTPAGRTTPWLGRPGLVGTVLLYLLGCAIIFQALYASESFLAAPGQLAGVALVALVLIAAAFTVAGRRPAPRRPGPTPRWRGVPPVWLLGTAAFLTSSAFIARPQTWWGGVVVPTVGLLGGAALVIHWSRSAHWRVGHQFALVAGALPSYAWAGFLLTALIRPDDQVAWIGNAVFAVLAGLLLVVTGRRVLGRADDGPRVTGAPLAR